MSHEEENTCLTDSEHSTRVKSSCQTILSRGTKRGKTQQETAKRQPKRKREEKVEKDLCWSLMLEAMLDDGEVVVSLTLAMSEFADLTRLGAILVDG